MLRLFAVSGFAVPFEAIVFAFVCWYILSKHIIFVFVMFPQSPDQMS